MSTQDDAESTSREPLKGGQDINATATKGRDYSSIIDEKAIKKKKYIKWGIIGALILIAVILAIVLPITLSNKDNGGNNPPNPPIPPAPPIPDSYNPYTLSKDDVVQGSSTFQCTLKAPTEYNQALHLQAIQSINPVLKDGTKKLNVDSKGIPSGPNNKFSTNIQMNVDMIKWKVAHLTLTDTSTKRYSIPEKAVPKPPADDTMRLDMLGFKYNLDPFYISFTDPRNPDTEFLSTNNQSLVFMDRFIQMDFLLPSQRLFGLGERIHDFQLGEGTWTMWAIGLDSPVDDGTGRKGVYGVHPFVMVQTQNKGDFIGIFFRNSNAQSPVIKYRDDGKSVLSYITTGGQLEVYFFIHGTAKDIISQYHQYFGKPNLPPFWSLGWQQASWKYVNQSMVEEAIDKYAQNFMPLDTVYIDIPYMNGYADFTINTTAFHDLQGLADRLHKANQKLVLIVDAAISAEDISDKNLYYTQGNKDDVFIKSGMYKSKTYNNNLISKVWPETAVFVDWFNDKCETMWNMGLYDLYNKVNYDGLWIDMNEPTTFQNAEKVPDDAELIMPEQHRFLESAGDNEYDYSWYYHFNQDEISTFKLPFIPRYDPKGDGKDPFTSNYDFMTLSLNATNPSIGQTQYNIHSLYGHMMASKTHKFMTNSGPKPDDRPFLLTRSSFASTGRFASHWLGDNWRSWDYMAYSVAGVMNMNMFGIPQAGADVCGFFGKDRDSEMCARWIQLAQFYPLARNHQNLTFNGDDSDFSEPYTLEGKYKDWARKSIRERYRYLRQLYTCLYEVNQNGGTCFDPLFYHFPQDDNVYQDYSSTFIYANGIKVSPILHQLADNETSFKAYFPKGKWVSLNNFANIVDSAGEMKDLPVDNDLVHAHLMPGAIVAQQSYVTEKGQQVMTTADLLTMPISILINRDENGAAKGSLLLDDGISISEFSANEFEYYTIVHSSQSIQLQLANGARGQQSNYVDKFVITNAKDMQYASFACYMGPDKSFTNLNFKYDDVQNALFLTPKSSTKFNEILNVYYGKKGDLNICDPMSFQYRLAQGSAEPNLTLSQTEFDLEHVAGVLQNIHVTLRVIETDIVNVKWTWVKDKDGKYPPNVRIPAEVPDDIISTNNSPLGKTKLSSFVSVQTTPTFQLNFKYRSLDQPSNVLTIKGMIFDSYLNWIDVTANTPSQGDFSGVFGLGERANKNFFLRDGVYSMWARDIPTPDETGSLPGANMYGTHPFFMYKHKQNAWVGVLYKLAHAQDWWVKNNIVDGTVDLSTIATGGVADIYVMQGKVPDQVVSNYFKLIGNPVLIPQWALGWNQCRWGYRSVQDLQAVLDGYDKYNIPLDVSWSDIDYLNSYRDFEFDQDPKTFADLPTFVDMLHTKRNMKYVPIFDAGIAYRPNKGTYPAFDEAMTQDIFTKIDGKTFIGQVWPNDASFPDYFHPNTSTWFKSNLDKFYSNIKFDGLWEDMNEASNFCNGACYPDQQVAHPVKNKLKYTPTGRDLEGKSMPLDTTHYNGYLQLDAHSYYGTQEVQVTNDWFKSKNMRTFIIDRSSFAGMGKFGSRWLGDNFSEEKFMGYSVSGTMMMNIFGITFTGSDICGFIGDTNPELCAKWHVLGAFYPFSRNHNNWGQLPQEPYSFGDQEYEKGVKYVDIMRNAILLKYSLIRYYYTNLFLVSTQGTGTFYKPLFFEFPDDVNAYSDITYNIMIGSALKLSINSESVKQTSTDFYFPAGIWCDIIKASPCMVSTGQKVSMTNKVYDFGLHLRQGYIIPFQDVSQMETVKTTVDLQKQPIDLHILGEPNTQGSAAWRSQGLYVNDDGLTTDLTNNFNVYSVVGSGNKETITVSLFNTYQATTFKDVVEKDCMAVNQNDFLKNIYIYNAKAFQNNMDYKVSATLNVGTDPLDLGTAKYNDSTDRVELMLKTAVCMTKITRITFQKA